jgi:hypothetical protein
VYRLPSIARRRRPSVIHLREQPVTCPLDGEVDPEQCLVCPMFSRFDPLGERLVVKCRSLDRLALADYSLAQ